MLIAESAFSTNYFLMKYDAQGQALSAKQFGPAMSWANSNLLLLNDGRLSVQGAMYHDRFSGPGRRYLHLDDLKLEYPTIEERSFYSFNAVAACESTITSVVPAREVAAAGGGLLAYPNPGDGAFTLVWRGETSGDARLTLTSAQGAVLLDPDGQGSPR